MFAFLKRTIVILLGFLLIAFLIWYFGPFFGWDLRGRWRRRSRV